MDVRALEGLEEILEVFISEYPAPELQRTRQEFLQVLEIALPSLGLKALTARQGGKNTALEVWKAIRGEAEEDFQQALGQVERLKVLYVASKFMNNRAIGTFLTEKALELTQSKGGL